MNDSYFASINESDKEIVIDKILSDVKGRMLEDIVLLETSLSFKPDYKVFKYISYQYGEIDMVIYHKNSFDMYEIKHSDKIAYDNQTKYLNDKNITGLLKQKYGEMNKKCVLYNGISTLEKDIHYLNVAEYLNSLNN